jgi:hypothetical protein
MNFIRLGLDAVCYYSKKITIKTETETRYKRYTQADDIEIYGRGLVRNTVFITSVYDERTQMLIEQLEATSQDGARTNFNQLKTKYIFDYGNLLSTSTSKESQDKGGYDFSGGRCSILGR